MVLYPDNRQRGDRVSQLATQIAVIETQLKGAVQNIRKKDGRTIVVLDVVVKTAGYKARQEYIDAALRKLTPEQREEYEEIKRELDFQDEALEIAWDVSGGVLGIAIFAGADSSTINSLLGLLLVRMSLYTMGVGVVRILSDGSPENIRRWMAVIKAGGKAVGLAVKKAGLSAKFVTAMKYFKNAARVLTVIAVILDGILLIYEAIEGAQQRTALREAIVELCARRFDIQKMRLSIMACDSFTDIASSIINSRNVFDQLVKDGTITKKQADEAVVEEIKGAVPKVQKEMDEITDELIWQLLIELDLHSGNAWTNEDPSLYQVLKWIEDHPDETRDGDDVRWRIEIPDSWRRRHSEKVNVEVCVSVYPAKL